MESHAQIDYVKLLNEVIQKQALIFGSEVTQAKLRQVKGIKLNHKGEVVSLSDKPEVVFLSTIEAFSDLCPLTVNKTLDVLLPHIHLDGSTVQNAIVRQRIELLQKEHHAFSHPETPLDQPYTNV